MEKAASAETPSIWSSLHMLADVSAAQYDKEKALIPPKHHPNIVDNNTIFTYQNWFGGSIIIPKKRRSCTIQKQTVLPDNPQRELSTQSKHFNQINKFKRLPKIIGPHPPPDLPTAFKDHITNMGGNDVVLVIQKKLFKTDMDTHHCRFSIPKNQFRTEFLSEEEEEVLTTKKGDIKVELIEPCLERCEVSLNKWKMNNTYQYALALNWKSVLQREANQLKIDILVQLWAFRVEGNLCFALVNLTAKDGEDGNSGSSSNTR